MIDKNTPPDNPKNKPVINVVDGKISINDKIFEHTELQEIKKYLQNIGADKIQGNTFIMFETLLCYTSCNGRYFENPITLGKLHTAIIEMGHQSPPNDPEQALNYFLADQGIDIVNIGKRKETEEEETQRWKGWKR